LGYTTTRNPFLARKIKDKNYNTETMPISIVIIGYIEFMELRFILTEQSIFRILNKK
jgi:hypothetical protein